MDIIDEGINSYLEGDVNRVIRLFTTYLENGGIPLGHIYYYLGMAYSNIGKHTEAGTYFNKALELEPEKGMYHYQLALVYAQLMLFQQAIPHLLKTLEQNPEHIFARVTLGKIYFKNGDMPLAAEHFRKITEISPDYADGFYELGNSLYYQGETPEAEKAFLRTVELNREHPDAYYKLGRLYAEAKDYERATEYMRSAFRLGMDSLPFLSHFALVLLAAGQKEQVMKLLKTAEETYPDSPEIVKIREMLSE
ncbi:MAG: tetratricopeptide repeat protein [Deferribacteraceae bacterium]|jgi:tetratricopeptide (TPR) repeat protein|nr:tetratricopeptide repeat protein [Deferribacteraceae bacterium]